MMKKTKILSVVLSASLLLSNGVLAAQQDNYDKFEQISNYAANLYIDESADASKIMENALRSALKDNPELTNELIKAGFQSLDEYTEFYTKEDYELFNNNLNHVVYGIGVVIQQVDDYVTVMSCVKGGGAELAGILSGDKISKVDGVSAKGLSVDKVQDMVVGELGTDVTITFLRDGMEFDRTITRAEVSGTTVSGTVLDGNIGYIEIINFALNTADEFYDTLAEFDESGVTDIIIDLRDNPGGYLMSAVNIASLLVPEGKIVSTVYRNPHENEDFYSELKEPKYKLCVLVNENTASAAEVLSSAIQDSDTGILVGETTYGKGVIQQMFDIWDGCAFKITTGRYYTRNGNDINGSGIEPNVLLYNSKKAIDVSEFTPFDYKTKPASGDSSQNVVAAKERLTLLGYYGGGKDDVFNKSLEEAVYKFQQENELFPYGVLDISTQVKIENTFAKLEETVDNQLIYAYEYFGGNADKLYDK